MDDKSKFLLQVSHAKIAALEKALERNWIIHLVLAGLGVALGFDLGDLPKVLARYFSQEQYSIKPVAVIILPVLLYYFMKCREIDEQDLTPLRDTTSFFEPFYSGDASKPILIAYFLTAPVIVSLTQASAFFLVVKAYGLNPVSVAILGLSGVVLAILYSGFWRANRNHRATTITAIVCPALVIVWLALFAKFA
jgi:hypothetical protein